MSGLSKIFKKAGGKELIWQYAHMHVLIFAAVETLLMGFSRKGLEIVREAVSLKQLNWLRRKYRKYIITYCQEHANDHPEHLFSKKVWVCWLQGIEQAPPLVQQCYQSICDNIPKDHEIVVLTEHNYKDYVKFPDYVQEKIDSGIITKTHFSDLLRLELLNLYGGTWIDATVLLSGKDIPEYMLDSELFMFQMLNPGLNSHPVRISSWFMTAYSAHPILMLTQSLLYEYWKKNNRLVDYFLLHYFIELSIEQYPEEWGKVIPFSNSLPHILLLRLFESYNDYTWSMMQKMTPIHKLTYKFDESDTEKTETYYARLFK